MLQNTRQLYQYWNRIRAGRPAPWRSDVEPMDIHTLLPDVFIAERQTPASYAYRLAGTRLCATYRRELKGRDMLELWERHDREGLETLLHMISEDGATAVISFSGQTDRGQSLTFEMFLAPLRQHDGTMSRYLGTITPSAMPYWLGTHPIVRHAIEDLDVIWPDDVPNFMRRAVNESTGPGLGTQALRRKGHLTLYQGGRSS